MGVERNWGGGGGNDSAKRGKDQEGGHAVTRPKKESAVASVSQKILI